MFITGAFVSHSCWKEWIVFFENKGYKAVAPPWPYKNDLAEILRNEHPNSKIASLRLQHVLNYYIEIIEKLPEKPILIGHSYGGLLTQLLIQKEMAAAGVCINSIPPQSVANFRFYKTIWKTLGYFSSVKKTYLMTFEDWQKTFTNEMTFEDQKEYYRNLVTPESKLVLRDIITKKAKINFKKRHEPLLFLSGSNDNFIPPSLNYSNFKKYKNLYSITCYKEVKDKNHLILNQSGWENIALIITDWIEKVT
ncbi:MAG: alpha/beta hydrolase [Flavobacterium sp.]|nr:MAG: alpha/beta hydrolase [Flavobacterium sp.]